MAVLGVLLFVRMRSDLGAVEREVTALRELGVPTTPAELRAVTSVPPDKNAAGLYLEAFASLAKHGKQMPSQSVLKTGETLESSVRAWVHAQAPTLDLVLQASRMPGCDFGRKWEQGALLLLPEFAQMKTLGKLAAQKARLEAAAGHYDEAMKWLGVGQAVARHADEPILIGALVSVAIDSIVHAELQREIEAYGSSRPFREAAAEFLARDEGQANLFRGLFGEVLFVRLTIAQLRSGELRMRDVMDMSAGGVPSNSGGTDSIARMLVPLVGPRVEATLLRRYRSAFETMREGKLSLESQMAAGNSLDNIAVADTSLSGKLAEVLAPVFAQAGNALVRPEVNRRLSLTGLALWEEEARTGRFPGSIPNQPWAVDPYSGKPFLYRPSPKSFVLYSVGANKLDEGGKRIVGSQSDDIQYASVKQAP